MNEPSIPLSALIVEIRNLLSFPRPTVCKHYVVLNLLDRLQRHGISLSVDLIQSLVDENGDDSKTLEELNKWEKEVCGG